MAAKGRSRKRAKQSPSCSELLVMELQQIHNAETQLARALPRFGKMVDSEHLQEMIERREQEGERLRKEIESALDELEESPGRRRNVAAEGLIGDLREHTEQIEAGPALEAALIAGLQKTEHYCIAAWGTARTLAEAIGQRSTVRAMERALKEGKSYDEELTELAEREIMPELLSAEEDAGQEDEEEPQRAGRGRRNGAERRVSS